MSAAIGVSCSDAVATVRLNRPDRLNAFDGAMMGQLRAALEQLRDDEAVRVIVLTGAGRAFCAGADVATLKRLRSDGDGESFRRLLEEGKQIFRLLKTCPQPVIAAVNGVAAGGGCSLALAADFRLAGRSAVFVQAFIRIGLHPDFGAYWSLPALLGQARARHLMMTGEPVEADRALEWGLVTEVVDDEVLAARTAEQAQLLACRPRRALAAVKQGLALHELEACERLLDFEIEKQVELFETDDAGEGIEAFLEKRPPKWLTPDS